MVEQETETVEELIDQFVGKKAKYTTQEGFNMTWPKVQIHRPC